MRRPEPLRSSQDWFDVAKPAPNELSQATAPLSGKTLHLDFATSETQTAAVMRALAHPTRVAILHYLGNRIVPVNQIAQDLGLPTSTATAHINTLERFGLIQTELQPARRGLQKICVRRYDELIVSLPQERRPATPVAVVMMPVGGYSDFHVEPSCGLASADGLIGMLDDPQSFYEPDRMSAQLLWFRVGYVEYLFPSRVPAASRITSLQFSAEICSEAPLSDPDWPSDISLWINGVHLGVWTSPADYGGQRGRLTPAWWEDKDTQYGSLKRWRVSPTGTTIDGVSLSSVGMNDLSLRSRDPIRIRVGVQGTAENVGGVNLFGREFGNYPQDLELRIEYEPAVAIGATIGTVESAFPGYDREASEDHQAEAADDEVRLEPRGPEEERESE
jgi:predicted transcriptional regulator